MRTVKTRWLTVIAAIAGGLGLSALSVPAASAQSAPPTLSGEQFFIPPGEFEVACLNAGPFSFTVSGTATGPYAGPFSETVSGTADGNSGLSGQITSYTTSFTITSTTGDVTGTETLASSSDACYQDSTHFIIDGTSDYQATIKVSAGAYTDHGTTGFRWDSGVPLGGTDVTVGGGDGFTSSQAQTTPVPPDLSLSDSAPATAASGTSYSYTLTATNTGGSDAASTVVTDTLPASAHFDSATTSQGTCTRSPGAPAPKGGTVTCAAGTLAAGTSMTITITVTPTKPGTIRDNATTGANGVTTDSDDTASASTRVLGS
jgi:uncharacterized repeat protein (TIGR01451 family)